MSEVEGRSSGEFPGYGFTFAVPGKYYRTDQKNVGDSESRIHAWAPLSGFPWRGERFDVANDLFVVPANAYKGYEEVDGIRQFLSPEEVEECRSIGHWLEAHQRLRDEVSVRVRMNSFLLALWIARPTRTRLTVRFQEIDEGERVASRILERFQWIEGYVVEEVSTGDLERVRSNVQPIIDLYTASHRLRNALVLTFRGCVATDWQSSFICLTAAAEALLTHSAGPGVVGRLADAFARLTSDSEEERRAQRDHFRQLYAVRSDIMHGRGHDRRTAEANLNDLAGLRDAVRALWRRVLESSEIRKALDSDDKTRLKLLSGL
jgi:hypothetical protein